ncbi:MaoC/PaaZ C-terminal domain-containing protein [Achromobacter aloeverae]|uniref:3-alpha,7-alpha, 12-alpha-trihydroxy-5-beta-cholest-24-enoyl-CoA hydratase n=1 Tax=Achromobacter aloeverae TaxID=1750518 RepID=A0A4Q1HJ17_9BURK|nr:MaoC/PaaZ C-terminal domain-containing protein [Achromobacter aloeverae]RXN88051.1 3-alpha,7-alpha,12-alpha-trihydroxy-5-beta-cholest-24-enoyl-CoA hydratase [Achromobacter aloeverae]
MNLDAVKTWSKTTLHEYSLRDSALYALAIGAVSNPLDSRQLRLVDERDQVAVPTMAAVVASPGFWARDEQTLGLDATKLVQGEQRIEIDRPLPAQGRMLGISRICRVVDKGPAKGALITVCKTLQSESGDVYGRAWQLFYCRGDGGFSASGSEDITLGDTPAPLTAAPAREPDRQAVHAVRSDAALLYRLCGDNNRLHIDPEVARRAGFPRPVLHGLATYGYAAVAIIQAYADGDAERLTAFGARFSAPVYPSDVIEFRMWDNGGHVALEGRVPARDAVVISHAEARLQPSRGKS